jgi:hypothetical protein
MAAASDESATSAVSIVAEDGGDTKCAWGAQHGEFNIHKKFINIRVECVDDSRDSKNTQFTEQSSPSLCLV